PAALEHALLDALDSHAPLVDALPARISIFGMSSLPPMYVRALAALARHRAVHVFQLSPTRGWWGDVPTHRDTARALGRGRVPQDLHLADDNPLLSSFGKLGADLMKVMSDELDALGVAEVEPEADLYREPDESTLLGRLQSDILHARAGRWSTPPMGRSFALHACHSPMREVEVLHDQLLELLGEGRVAAHEVVVMMSDVPTYAPLVEAVFDREPRDPRALPYRIADRSLRSESPALEALHRMLAMVGGRAQASQLLDLLALDAVRNKLELAPEEVDTLRAWVVEAGVRWGIDAEHRAQHGQPPVYENTWRFGLDRLLLGYAMDGGGLQMFAGRLPFDHIEGQKARTVGKLAAFCERMFEVVRAFATPRSLSAWRDALLELIDDLLAYDPIEHERIRRALVELCEAADAAGFDEDVELDVLRELLDEQIDQRYPARGFLSGGITFCAMVPMRSIPFRVVCMLGMNDGIFPRTRRPADFDLMTKAAPRPGDRARREDDRYLFLEALLAARERVIILYTGQSVRDGTRKAPSVVLSELCDYLVASHAEGDLPDDPDARLEAVHPGLITHHPLQPFSPRYFDASDPRLFSYAHELCAGARRLSAGVREPGRFFVGRLPDEPREPWVELSELVRFFEGPARYLMNRRLGIDMRETDRQVPDREPLELGPLDQYRIGEHLLELSLQGLDAEETERLARASGALAPGTPGECDHALVLESATAIAKRVLELRGESAVAPMLAELRLEDGTLVTGEIRDRWQGGVVRHQYARVSGKQLLASWVRHLALCAVEPADSMLIGRGANKEVAVTALRLRRVSDPEPLLADLLELFRLGRCEPLLLFPRTSFELSRLLSKGLDATRALEKLGEGWELERKRDPHVAWLFPMPLGLLAGPSPLGDGDFRSPGLVDLARRVFEPMLLHLEEV
ncbi:MAG TPA: exodeoxyribonuclease V subunit gamma, partial [Polyangiaceae bacterium]|nr:exodeoxyribonuclease V subunit gamma [Polyangiaceae bacterium]